MFANRARFMDARWSFTIDIGREGAPPARDIPYQYDEQWGIGEDECVIRSAAHLLRPAFEGWSEDDYVMRAPRLRGDGIDDEGVNLVVRVDDDYLRREWPDILRHGLDLLRLTQGDRNMAAEWTALRAQP